MAVEVHRQAGGLQSTGAKAPAPLPPRERFAGALGLKRTGELLGEWHRREIRLAHGFSECRGLSREQLEDLYQDTATALLTRAYHSEEHLRNALRTGIKHRALNAHRDQRRRGEILAQRAPELQMMAEARSVRESPEDSALALQDRLIVREFLAELSPLERRVFCLQADGMRYRRIAPVLGIATNAARSASRSCERKRERFQLLYEAGRLCGYRRSTIRALRSGSATSEDLAERAFAHLEACSRCRAEHRTNAARLRSSFARQVAALLPLPVSGQHLLARLIVRARIVHCRALTLHPPGAESGVRERVTALVAGGGACTKAIAGALTAAVIAGGSIGAGRLLHTGHAHRAPRHHDAAAPETAASIGPVTGPASAPVEPLTVAPPPRRQAHAAHRRPRRGPGHVIDPRAGGRKTDPAGRHEPGGFAYLGVPRGPAPAPGPGPAGPTGSAPARGGPFSP